MNKCLFVGRLVNDPETKTTNSGLSIANFRMAVQSRKDNTEFLDFTAFGKTAEFIAEYFQKGKPASVMSRAHVEQWESDGQQRRKVVFYVDEISFVPGEKNNNMSPSPTTSNVDNDVDSDEDMDIPF